MYATVRPLNAEKKHTGLFGIIANLLSLDFSRKVLLLSVTCNVFANNLDIEEVLGDGASTSGLRTVTVPRLDRQSTSVVKTSEKDPAQKTSPTDDGKSSN